MWRPRRTFCHSKPKRLKLTSTGYLRDRMNSSGRDIPWIAVLECLI